MIEKITAGVDWISASLDNRHIGYHVWYGDALYALEKVASDGYTLKSSKLLGFEGYRAGNCFVGVNETLGYAQFSGEKADWAFDFLNHPQAKYSRLDVQLTAKSVVMDANEGKRCYRAAMDNNSRLPMGRRRKIWIIIGSDGGDTCYLGAASSDQRARIYNKEVQSEELRYTRCWRYEVVFRDQLSTQLYATIASGDNERADVCAQVVIDWLTKRGVSMAHIRASGRSVLPIERTRPNDVERSIKWLKDQVSPTLKRLSEQGYRNAALEAIGIDLEKAQEDGGT